MSKRKVTKEEFDKFIESYPKYLNTDVYAAFEPPLVSYNDFTKGNWPKSVVASTYLYSDKVGDHYYEPPEKREYYIVEE